MLYGIMCQFFRVCKNFKADENNPAKCVILCVQNPQLYDIPDMLKLETKNDVDVEYEDINDLKKRVINNIPPSMFVIDENEEKPDKVKKELMEMNKVIKENTVEVVEKMDEKNLEVDFKREKTYKEKQENINEAVDDTIMEIKESGILMKIPKRLKKK